ncbi:MAG: hypothetical protein ACYDD9_03080 [Acidithiobacillus sp.]
MANHRSRQLLYGKPREVQAYDQVFMLKTLRCPTRVASVPLRVSTSE